jgi:hypothetical protein
MTFQTKGALKAVIIFQWMTFQTKGALKAVILFHLFQERPSDMRPQAVVPTWRFSNIMTPLQIVLLMKGT